MAITRYKALVAEKDKIELNYHEEAALDASNVFYDNLTYDNVQNLHRLHKAQGPQISYI